VGDLIGIYRDNDDLTSIKGFLIYQGEWK